MFRAFATAAAVLLLSAGTAQAQTVRYVDAAAAGGAGNTWADAFNDLQLGLAAANSGDQIWVAAGTYTPAPLSGPRSATFQLKSGVALYGGFAGIESTLGQRDFLVNATILSGDLAGDDESGGTNAENSYHVVTTSGTDDTTVLDGFTITKGNADGPADQSGAGILNSTGSPTFSNCWITNNTAVGIGGGMSTGGGISRVRMSNCHFIDNSALAGGGLFNGADISLTDCSFSGNSAIGAFGGGMVDQFATSTLTNCIFVGNTAARWGGGLSNLSSSETLINTAFIGNISDNRGGGVFNSLDGSMVLTNCAFIGNVSNNAGGAGMYNRHSSTAVLTNCVFSGNSGIGSGAIKAVNNTNVTLTNCTISGNSGTGAGGGGVLITHTATATLTNCVLWGNASSVPIDVEDAQIRNTSTGSVSVSYSLIEGLSSFSGSGNIGLDPLFVDSDGADNVVGTEDDDLRLSAGSPAIDSGDSSAVPIDSADLDGDLDTAEPIPLDLDGGPRFIDDLLTTNTGIGIVDMGAYEFGTPDGDGDGAPDSSDNCPTVFNPGQEQTGNNVGTEFGDACVNPNVAIPDSVVVGTGVVIEDSVDLGNDVTVGDNTTLEQSATVKDGATIGSDVILGESSTVEEGATVGDGSTLEADSTVKPGAEIGEDVTIGEGATIEEGAVIGDGSVIGANSTVKMGAVVGTNVVVGTDTQIEVDAQVGDGAMIGNDVTVKSGVVVPAGAVIPDGATVE